MGYKTATDFGKTFMKNAFKGLDGDKHVLFTFDEIKSLFYLLEGSKRKYKAPDRSLLYGHALACIKVLLIYLFFVYRIVDNKVAKEFVMGRNLPNRLG